MPAGPLLGGKFHPKEAFLTPWFSVSVGEELFPWFFFLREQLDKNLSTETWQGEAFAYIFVICVHLLEDSADLDSIEAVANEVLNMEMPSTPQQLQALTEDIRERVESLSDVEVILQQSAGDIARAEMLLEEAKKARYATFFSISHFQSPRACMRLSFHCIRKMQSLTFPDVDSHSFTKGQKWPFVVYDDYIFRFQSKSIFSINIVLLHSKGATDVKVTADMVKAALEEAEKAQNAAEKAIKQADEDIKGTQDLLTSVSSIRVFKI